MRFALASVGSRGDVEPFAALASALARRHHTVTLALDLGHHALPSVTVARRAGASVIALGGMSAAELAGAVAQAVVAVTPEARSRVGYEAFIGRRLAHLRRELETLATAHDLLVVSDGLAVIDAERAPRATATAMLWYTLQPETEYRRLAALDCLHLAALPSLLAPPDPSLAARIHFTGFWLDGARGPLAPEVEVFLAAGPPPLFLTMGSMAGFDAAALLDGFLAVGRARRHRMIIQRGWAALAALVADDVLVVDEVSYASLFPRCAALFVHGGTGTVAHALAAARPLAVMPLVADQVAWAHVVGQLGCGLGIIDPRRDDRAAWQAAMSRAGDPSVSGAAARVAAHLSRDPGIDAACDLLERALE